MKYTKLAIHGLPDSGKSTLATLLQRILERSPNQYQCFIFAFADPIKKIAKAFIGLDYYENEYGEPNEHEIVVHNGLYGHSEFRETIIPNFSQEPVTFRDLIDKLGEMGRGFDPDIWIKKTLKKIKLIKENDLHLVKNHLFVIPDLRRPNELKYVKENNFCLVRIKRNQKSEREFQANLNALDHLPDSDFDFVIENNGSLDELKLQVEKLVEFLISE